MFANMSMPFRVFLLAVAGLMIAILGYHLHGSHKRALVQNVPVTVPVQSSSSAVGNPSTREEVATNGLLHLRPDRVLATVNGRQIKLGDVVPLNGNDNGRELEISSQDIKFLLKRAVDRELIFQTAKEQRLMLNDAQYQQLANLSAMRNQREPGGIARLNLAGTERELERLDSEAFMLQTALMAARGATPNVTEEQVTAYYQEHQSQFGDLPADETARARAWSKMDFGIREQLAAATRASYNDKLAAYMKQVESSANIVMAPLDQPLNTD